MNEAITTSLYDGEVTLTFDPEEHTYTWHEIDRPVPGPTSVLDRCISIGWSIPGNWATKLFDLHLVEAIQPYVETDELGATRLRIPLKEFQRITKEGRAAHRDKSKKALNIGTLVHAYAEEFITKGKAEMPIEPKAIRGCEAFLEWYGSQVIKTIASERLVLSRKYYYAGKPDLHAIIDGRQAIVDFKTSTVFSVPAMPYQLAAYAVAIEEESGILIEDGWIVRLDKETGKCEPRHYPLTDEVKQGWIDLLTSYRSITETEKFYGLRQSKAA